MYFLLPILPERTFTLFCTYSKSTLFAYIYNILITLHNITLRIYFLYYSYLLTHLLTYSYMV